MSNFQRFGTKDPAAVINLYVTLGSAANDGSSADTGYLQGRTLDKTAMDAATFAVSPSGLTISSHSVVGTTMVAEGVTYPANTVVQFTVSGGSALTDYNVTIPITLSTSETDERTYVVPCDDL